MKQKHKEDQKAGNPFSQEPMAAPEKLAPAPRVAPPSKEKNLGYKGSTAKGDPVAKSSKGYTGVTAKGDPVAKPANVPGYSGKTTTGDPVAKSVSDGYSGTTVVGDPTALSKRKGLKTATSQ